MDKKIEEIKADQWNQCVDKLKDKYPYLAEAPLSEPEADDVMRFIAECERLEKENENLQKLLKESDKDIETECKLYNELSTKYTKLQRVVACAKDVLVCYFYHRNTNKLKTDEQLVAKLQQALADYEKDTNE